MCNVCIISAGQPESRIDKLKQYLINMLSQNPNIQSHYNLDLCNYDIPFVFKYVSENEKNNLDRLKELISINDTLIFMTPIYNHDVAAELSSFLEHVGNSCHGKTVGIVASAGSSYSYMALMPFINTLMLSFRCWVVPRFVYVDRDGFHSDTREPKDDILRRMRHLCDEIVAHKTLPL